MGSLEKYSSQLLQKNSYRGMDHLPGAQGNSTPFATGEEGEFGDLGRTDVLANHVTSNCDRRHSGGGRGGSILRGWMA